jgi:hypothetical protein
MLCACSAQQRQLRKTKAASKRNIERQEAKKKSGEYFDPNNLGKDDVNYKDLDKIRSQCLYVKNGKRCTRKAGNYEYCKRHRPKGALPTRRRD